MWSQLCPTQGSLWPIPTEATPAAPQLPKSCHIPNTPEYPLQWSLLHCWTELPFLPRFLSFMEVEQAIFNTEAAQKRGFSFVGVIRNLLESVLGMWEGCCGLNEGSIMHFWQWHIQVLSLSVAWLHWNLLVPAELTAFPHKTQLFPEWSQESNPTVKLPLSEVELQFYC